MKLMRSLFFYPFFFVSTIALGASAIVTAFLTHNSKWAHLIGRLWGNVNLRAAGVRVQITGLENIKPHQPYVFLSNHQGWFDIFTILGKLPVQFRWLAKEELFTVFVLGPAMRAAEYIPIDRSNHRKSLESINQAAMRVREGTSVVIFPEGTRSPDGRLQDFKKGGFILAIKSQQPIVAIAISGSSHVLPKQGTWLIEPGIIEVTVEKPIATAGLKLKDHDMLMSAVREAMRRHLTPAEGGFAPESQPPANLLSANA